MNRRQEVAAALLMLAILAMGSSASAQPAEDPVVDFVVTPSRLEIRVAPGDFLQVPVRVFNRAAQPLQLTTYVQDIEIPTTDLVAEGELAFTASKWVRFADDTLAVTGSGDGEATLDVVIPEATPSGGYHAFAYFQSVPGNDTGAVASAARIGVTLLLEVAPEGESVARAARVSDSTARVRWRNVLSPRIEATTTVVNTGDAHVLAGGVHRYRAWPGSATEEIEIGPYTTLRGTRHEFATFWDAVPLFGKVTITSELVYQVSPDDLPVILTQHTVWIIPWHLIAVGVLLAAGTGAYLGRHRIAGWYGGRRLGTEKT